MKMENKQDILDSLLETIRLTKIGNGIQRLEYVQKKGDGSYVIVHWTAGGVQYIDVALDSGIAMISDVCGSLG